MPARMTLKRPFANWPVNTIPMSIPATKKRKRSSKRSTRLMKCSRTRTNAANTIQFGPTFSNTRRPHAYSSGTNPRNPGGGTQFDFDPNGAGFSDFFEALFGRGTPGAGTRTNTNVRDDMRRRAGDNIEQPVEVTLQ